MSIHKLNLNEGARDGINIWYMRIIFILIFENYRLGPHIFDKWSNVSFESQELCSIDKLQNGGDRSVLALEKF